MRNLIESLETRRMFAAFNGTPGHDSFVVYVSPSGFSHVIVNGVDQMTFDAQLDINGLGGNDSVTVKGALPNTLVSINAGEGENSISIGDGDFDSRILGNVQVLGQSGHDTIFIDDHADATSDFNHYELTAFSFTKPMSTSARLDYFSVEELYITGSAHADAIKILGTAPGIYIRWTGGNGDDRFDVGNGDLGQLRGQLQVSAEGGNDMVVLHDQLAPGPQTYEVSNQSIDRPGLNYFEFNSAETYTLFTSAGDDTINVHTGSGAIAPIFIYSGNGNDTFKVETFWYTEPAPQRSLYFNGGNGSDTMNVKGRPGEHTYQIRPTEFTGDLLPNYSHDLIETLNVNGNSGAETFVIHGTRVGMSTTINAGAGDDAISVGGLFGQATLDDIDGRLTINGDGGADIVEFIDTNQTQGQTYSISGSTVARTNMEDVSLGTAETANVHAGIAPDTFFVNTTSSIAFTLLGNGAIDSFHIVETAPGSEGAVTIDGGGHLDFVTVNASGLGTAAARFVSLEDLASLSIGNGGLVMMDDPINDQVLITRDLDITPGGRLDLGDDAMLLDYDPTGPTPAATVRAWLASGRNGGTWSGASGITSTAAAANPGYAIACAESTALFATFPATFMNQTVDASTLLLRHALEGDVNLDGAVNLQDFNRLAANFASSGRAWTDGDFTYDGIVNLADFNRLAFNFGRSMESDLTELD